MKGFIFLKNKTLVCSRKKMLETAASIPSLLSTEEKEIVKKSYPQQIMSCYEL